jgi:phosphate:Na+ symporter
MKGKSAMNGTLLLINLAGAVGMLLWGTHMISTGILRGFGTPLRGWIGRNLNGRARAFLAGVAVTGLLQSSTATGLMATSFTASGLLALAPALSVMLGANVGTTLITQALSFDITAIAPLFVISGVVLFRLRDDGRLKNVGRVAIGLGLMLFALGLMTQALHAAESGATFPLVMSGLAGDPILALGVAALLTWACHSSVAVVLLVMSLAGAQVVPPATALALVLGANLGGTLPPLFEAGSMAARRLPLGNTLIRAAGCFVALPLLPYIVEGLAHFQTDAARLVVNFHTLFNLVLAIVFIGPIPRIATALTQFLPDPPTPHDLGAPQHLDEAALDAANVALANAARESLRMADLVTLMLDRGLDVLRRNDRLGITELHRLDQHLDRLGHAVRSYLACLSAENLNEADSRRAQEILRLTIDIEHAGDILATNLVELAMRKIKRGYTFTAAEQNDIERLYAAVKESLTLAIAVFLQGDKVAAQRLAGRKALVRRLESQATENHFQRLRDGSGAQAEAGDLFRRALRDLRRIHSHVAAVAYPTLESTADIDDARVDEVGQYPAFTLLAVDLPTRKAPDEHTMAQKTVSTT